LGNVLFHTPASARSTGFLALAIMALAVPAKPGPLEDKYSAALWDKYQAASGRGDLVTAMVHLRPLAEAGDAVAQWVLGQRYWTGGGVPVDDVLAHMWSNLSAAQGVKIARGSLGLIANLMTPDQIAEAQRMAREWTVKPLDAKSWDAEIRKANDGGIDLTK